MEGLDASAARIAYLVDGDEGGLAHRQKLLDAGIDENRIVILGGGNELAVEDLIERDTYLLAVNRELELRGRLPVPDDRVPDIGRKRAIADWCRDNNVEKPSERAVAHHLLDELRRQQREGLATRLLSPGRVAVVTDLHNRIAALLNQRLEDTIS